MVDIIDALRFKFNFFTLIYMPLQNWTKQFPVDKTRRYNFSAIMIAPRRSGKSTLLSYLLKTKLKDKYDLIYVFCSTDASGYEPYIKKGKVFTHFIPEAVDILMEVNRDTEKPANILLIYDDTASMRQKYSHPIEKLFTRGRHHNISVIYLTQDARMVSNLWKSNADLMFIFRQHSYRDQEYVVNNILLGMDETKQFNNKRTEFNYYLTLLRRETSKKYHMLVVDLTKHKMYWYKADI